MIYGRKIFYSYGLAPQFDEANFSIGKDQKAGLVGPNGAGKTTLFNLISGIDSPNAGTIVVEGKVGIVPQEVKHDPHLENAQSIRNYINPDNKLSDHELRQILIGLEYETDLDTKPQQLSGGQKTKLAIARAIIAEPDILLLDEPTNFLDIAGKKWLMNFLSHYPKTLLMISHDLKLLNRYIDKILYINIHTKKIEEYSGNYDQFLKLQKQSQDLLKRNILNEQKHIKKMKKGLIKMDRYSSEKGVRARKRLKDRIARLIINLPDMPTELKSIRIRLPEPTRVGEIPLMVKHIYKTYSEEHVLEDVSLSLYRGERMVLIGPNGAGKSTLIKILMQRVKQDSGEVIRDENCTLGYYSQEFETFDEGKTLVEMINEQSSQPESVIRPFLARFLFPGKKVFQKINTLSGGEKTRLSIATLLLKNYNTLILDEPTTYLDVMSQRIILEALKEFKGTMLVVSHTPEFIKELQPKRVLLLPQNRIVPWTDELYDKISEI